MQPCSLAGQVAIVTGSGRGIGAATALLLAAQGARVVVSDLDLDPARAVAEAITAAGGTAMTVAGDVTDRDFPQRLVNDVLGHFGAIDILVNNAGYTWDGMLHTLSDDQWDAMLAVHLSAPFRIIRAAAPYLRSTARQELESSGAAKARKIINVTSTSGLYGNAGQSNYASAKSGLIGLTRTLAREWGRFNIQTNAVCYGFIDTRLTADKDAGEQIERAGREIQLGIPEHLRNGFAMLHPMARTGSVEEAAGPVLFLASPLSNYVNGAILEVTGGMVF